MNKHPAKVLEPPDVRRLIKHMQTTRYPLRNTVMTLLSFQAGLRACEISGLTWPMVLAANGKVSDALYVTGNIAKMGSARAIPLATDLRNALIALHEAGGRPHLDAVIRSERGSGMSPKAIVNWFKDIYDQLNLEGCSSHSGRRTFITRAARMLPKIDGSLRDVQELAGHRSLTTTERYIQGDRRIQRKLVNLI